MTKLMTYQEYNSIQHDTPYTFIISKNNKHLYYFGEEHSYDPSNKQWNHLRKFWKDFLENTNKKIVLVEGGLGKLEKSENESISNGGSSGLMLYLSDQENIEIFSPEPDESFERNELLKQFSKEEIQYYYFIRIVYQWNNITDPKPNFEEYIGKYLEQDKIESNWDDFDFSLENMYKIHGNIFGNDLDILDTKFQFDALSPTIDTSISSKVARASSMLRDESIVKEIKRQWDNGNSVFVVYGVTHAIMQEALLRDILD